jgi:hypothetical protein
MTEYGAKVSKPGFDVKTALEKELGFSSLLNSLKISAEGTGVTENAGVVDADANVIVHGLGYKPTVLVFWKDDAGKWYFHTYLEGLLGNLTKVWVDTQNLYVLCSAAGMTFKYFIFVEEQ